MIEVSTEELKYKTFSELGELFINAITIMILEETPEAKLPLFGFYDYWEEQYTRGWGTLRVQKLEDGRTFYHVDVSSEHGRFGGGGTGNIQNLRDVFYTAARCFDDNVIAKKRSPSLLNADGSVQSENTQRIGNIIEYAARRPATEKIEYREALHRA